MENYKNESMVDVAYSVLKEMEDKISFKELYAKVTELIGLSEEEATNKMSMFYTNLSLDDMANEEKENKDDDERDDSENNEGEDGIDIEDSSSEDDID